GALVLGGRNFEQRTPASLNVTLDGQALETVRAEPAAPFLRLIELPARGAGIAVFHELAVAARPPMKVAMEQLAAANRRPVLGFGEGWHELEYNPALGLRWRWLSERGSLHLARVRAASNLHVEGESPRKYFGRGSRLTIHDGERLVFDRVLESDFSLDVP